MKIMVSACLLGANCKYDGGNNLNDKVMSLLNDNDIIPVCPETLGGLPTPRAPAEIVYGTVLTRDGTSVDAEFRNGAEAALKKAKDEKPELVILQSRSPSCGVKQIYDGSFTGKKISGSGIFAKMLIDNGFNVKDIEDI